MPSAFAITTTTNSISLDASRKGEVVFTVFNASGRPLRARAELKPANPVSAPWLTLVPPTERDLAIAGAEQYRVQIAVLATAPAGSYTFGLDVVGIQVPDEDFATGPTVTFMVPEAQKVVKPFPWWIVAVGVVLLIAIGAAVVILTRTVEMPNVLEQSITAAEATVSAAGLAPGERVARLQAGAGPDQVLASTPRAGEKVKPGSTVVFVVSEATPTPTATVTHTPTPVSTTTRTPTATASPTATRTATPLAGKYQGTWNNVSVAGAAEITQLAISTTGNQAAVTVTGNFRTILGTGGGLAGQSCMALVGKPTCIWGQDTVANVTDPLVAEFKSQDGKLVHQLTVTRLPNDTTKISVAHRILLNGKQQVAAVYLLERSRFNVDAVINENVVKAPFIYERMELAPGLITQPTPVSP